VAPTRAARATRLATSRLGIGLALAIQTAAILGSCTPGPPTPEPIARQYAAAWEKGWKGLATDPVSWDRVNVNGSSISVGHPWSATGGRILTTLAYEMARRNARYGLISMCAAGAMAGAFLLTRE